MNIPNVSLTCCPKPKQNFNGASISAKAMKVLASKIAKNPLEMDDFKAISKLDINVDLDKYSPNNIEFLVIKGKNRDGCCLHTTVSSMKKLKESIENFLSTKIIGI